MTLFTLNRVYTVYYRLYQADGAIESRSPAYFNDHFLGRILSKAVTPPHTAASLKNYICKIEGFSGADIYSSLTSSTALNDGVRTAIMSYSGPGSYEKEPMFLLVKSAQRRTSTGFPPPSVTLENPAKSSQYSEVSSAAVPCFLNAYHPLLQSTIVSIIMTARLLLKLALMKKIQR